MCYYIYIYLLSITNASKLTVWIVSNRDLYFYHVHRRRQLIIHQKIQIISEGIFNYPQEKHLRRGVMYVRYLVFQLYFVLACLSNF